MASGKYINYRFIIIPDFTMSKILITNILALLVSCYCFGQSADEALIRQVIDTETKSFVNLSFSQVAELYWVMDDKTILNVTGPDGVCLQFNRSDIESRTSVPPPDHAVG